MVRRRAFLGSCLVSVPHVEAVSADHSDVQRIYRMLLIVGEGGGGHRPVLLLLEVLLRLVLPGCRWCCWSG